MKKILKTTLILFVFCLTFVFCGIFVDPLQTKAEDKTPINISSASELETYIKNYGGIDIGSGKSDDIINLTASIDMTGITLTNTIGNLNAPFSGTFNGNGFKISNLKIDARKNMTDSAATVDTNQYAGLFGYVKGGTIKSLALDGNFNIVTGGYYLDENEVEHEKTASTNTYVGALAGKLENATVSNVQNTANLTYTPNYDTNLFFGGLVGSSVSSNLKNIISNSKIAFGAWKFEKTSKKTYNLGGLSGYLSDSKVAFALISHNFNVSVSSDFVGQLRFGGLTGEVVQGSSEVYNVGIENSITYKNNILSDLENMVCAGDVFGKVSTPAPISGNLSYIYYKSSGLNAFGFQGNYRFKNEDPNITDYIKTTTMPMLGLEFFTNQTWHPLYSWDFDTVWYVNVQSIRLQNFYGNFDIKYLDSSENSVLEMKTTLENSYQYGQSVEMEFSFKNVSEDGASLSLFYDLSTINLNGSPIAKIITTNNDGVVSYRLSTLDDSKDTLDIQAKNDGTFVIKIKHVDKSTVGTYSVATTAKTFSGSVTSKLYKVNKDKTETLVEGIPGYVSYVEGTNRESMDLTLTYGTTLRLRTREKPNTPNIFVGWFIENDDASVNNGKDIALSVDKLLEINFGEEKFVDNFKIYAKYQDDARAVIFKLNEGVARIDLYSGEVSLSESGSSVSISKQESAFKMEIYVRKEFEFDTDQFITMLNSYKASSSVENFCNLVENYEKEGYNYYLFTLNMTTLNIEDFENELSIDVQTTRIQTKDMTWLWILLGCVGGVVLIGLVILIIILVKRRNSFGGGSGSKGGGSYNKKSYKNMYY